MITLTAQSTKLINPRANVNLCHDYYFPNTMPNAYSNIHRVCGDIFVPFITIIFNQSYENHHP